MLERELQAAVMDLVRINGLRAFHVHNSRKSAKGWPDLVIVGPGGVAYRELKQEDGRVSPEQVEWLAALEAAGQDVGVWRPEHLKDGTVQALLLRLRRPQRPQGGTA